MKKLLLILLCLPMIGFGQTYVPDATFEAFLEANGMGNGIANDNLVTTTNINMVDSLNIQPNFLPTPSQIQDLTGIQDFSNLKCLLIRGMPITSLDLSQNTLLLYLHCQDLQITSLDLTYNTALTELRCFLNTSLTTLNISQNTALISLECFFNSQLSSLNVSQNTALTNLNVTECNLSALDVSQNTALIELACSRNSLTFLDVSQNTALEFLGCGEQYITFLDVSNNTVLTYLSCWNSQLTSLDLRNGNNTNMTQITLDGNLNLYCINVDDSVYSTNNWNFSGPGPFMFDNQHYFSNNCSGTGIEEYTTNKELVKTIDILGRETKQTNQPLFYIYDDGTVEKRIVIE